MVIEKYLFKTITLFHNLLKDFKNSFICIQKKIGNSNIYNNLSLSSKFYRNHIINSFYLKNYIIRTSFQSEKICFHYIQENICLRIQTLLTTTSPKTKYLAAFSKITEISINHSHVQYHLF